MSFPYTPKMQDTKPESLQTQHEFLNLLRLRHLRWMKLAHDPEIRRMHLEIAELLATMTNRYHQLLDALQRDME